MIWRLPFSKNVSSIYCLRRFGFLFVFYFLEKYVKGACVSWFRHNYVGWASQHSNFIWKGDGRQLLKHCIFPFLSYLQNAFQHVDLFNLDPILSMLRVFRKIVLCQRFWGIWEHSQNQVLAVPCSQCMSLPPGLAVVCWQLHCQAVG